MSLPEILVLFAYGSINFSKNSFRNTIPVSNRLDPDQAHFVGPDLGPICLQRLSAEDNSRLLDKDAYEWSAVAQCMSAPLEIKASLVQASP